MNSIFNFTFNGMLFHICKPYDDYTPLDCESNTPADYEPVGEIMIGSERHVICQHVSADSEDLKRSDLDCLTKRELQIVVLVSDGHVNKVIASRLNISEWTVSTHLRRIFAKLRVDSRSEMVYRCAKLIDSHKLSSHY